MAKKILKTISLIAILSVMALLLLAGAAQADESHPINPYRKKAMELDRQVRELRARAENKRPGLFLTNAQKGLNITCNRQPALNGTGDWSISLAGGSASQVESMSIFLGMKDWCDDYTHIHWLSRDIYTVKENEEVFMNHYTSPQILTAGEYEVYFYVTYLNGNTAYYFHEFTISGTDALGAKVNSIVSSCKAGTQWQTALNLHDWLTHNIYYDASLEFYGADTMLRGYGVCDSYSKSFLLLCKAAGIPVARVANDNHAWNAVKLDGKWYYVDCTWDDPGSARPGEGSPVSGSEHHNYFCVNEKLLGLDHPTPWTWERATCQSCTALDANYVVHTGEWKKWGDYGYDYETGKNFVRTFSELAADAFDSCEKQFVIDWNERRKEYNGTDIWLWYMDGDDLISEYIGEREKIILDYAIPGIVVSVDGGTLQTKVTIESTSTKDRITIAIAGWKITEKGTLTLPKDLKTLSAYALQGNAATTVVIPNGCKTIGAGAFKNSKVRTVTIPMSVTSIADTAFDGCGRIIFKTKNQTAIEYAAEHHILVMDP